MRLGFAVSVLGKPRLRSHDGRRWPNQPHLSVSLIYLRDILEYLREQGISMYRMSSQLAPYVTHPDLPQFHDQISECSPELRFVGRLASAYGIRLSFHASPFVSLSTADPALARKSISDLNAWSRMLDQMELGPESVIVMHIGGHYEDIAGSVERFLTRCEGLPQQVRRRIAIENDDRTYSLSDVIKVAASLGVPVIFDYLHHLILNPEGLEMGEALARAVSTWPPGVPPKVHFSTPRTEMKVSQRRASGPAMCMADWNEHADFVNPFEFASFLNIMAESDIWPDVMLEAKAKDLALLRLRADMKRFAPQAAVRFEQPSQPQRMRT